MGGSFCLTWVPANANLLDKDFQDLLPNADEVGAAGNYDSALYKPKRPQYLTDPTAEFKENEDKAAEFRRQQIVAKQFKTVLDRFLTEPNNEDALIADLRELRNLVLENGGLPVGLKKEDLYKQIRVKKRAGFWPTNVEIAYQKLINEIIFQQSPNIEDKSGGNKFSLDV